MVFLEQLVASPRSANNISQQSSLQYISDNNIFESVYPFTQFTTFLEMSHPDAIKAAV